MESSGLSNVGRVAQRCKQDQTIGQSRGRPSLLLAPGAVTVMPAANSDSRLVIRWVKINLESLAAVACKADLGGDPAANQHDVGQQATERQLRAQLLFEVPEVAASGQRLVHVLAEDILCHDAGLNVAVGLQKRRRRCQELNCVLYTSLEGSACQAVL